MAILTREDSTNVSLLLARPEIEVRKLDMQSSGREAARLGLNTDLKMRSSPFISLFMWQEISWLGYKILVKLLATRPK